MSERDIEAIQTYERDEQPAHRSGRRDPPARCYNCGRDIEDSTVLLYGASFCSGACEDEARRSQR